MLVHAEASKQQPPGQPQGHRQPRKQGQAPRKAHHLDSRAEQEDDVSEYTMYNVSAKKTKPITAMVKMNGLAVQMEVDTGASMSIINDSTYRTLQTAPHTSALRKSAVG